MDEKNYRRGRNEEDEVEKLLQAAQDELLLKLSIDSHMSRVSPDYLHPDLDTRFQALKSKPPSNQNRSSKPRNPPPPVQGDDDLLARFAALKGKASSSSSNTTTVGPIGFDHSDVSDVDEEDEVEKIIQWAKDAARLDPSPPSDVDDDEFCFEDDVHNSNHKDAQK